MDSIITSSNLIIETKLKLKRRRLELRKLNLLAWERNSIQEIKIKLDTSLKKHTGLLVKLKSSLNLITILPSILKDLNNLSLEKYIDEIVIALNEGLIKCKSSIEINCSIEIISVLHQRFPNLFTIPLTNLLLQNLKSSTSTSTTTTTTDKDIKEKEDNNRIMKQRSLLRVLGELELVGIVRKDVPGVVGVGGGGGGKNSIISSTTTGELTWSVLKDLLTSGKDSLALAAPLAIAFSKHLGNFYLPPASSNSNSNLDLKETISNYDFPTLTGSTGNGIGIGVGNEEEEAEGEGEEEEVLVSREMKEKFRKLLLAYLDALGRRESKDHVELQKQDKRNHEAYIRSGEVFEDREKNYEKSVRAWERGWASVISLSEILGVPAPTLPSLASSTLTTSILTNGTSTGNGGGSGEEIGGPGSIWQDEEDKKFYEELRELRGEVPGSVLGVLIEKEKILLIDDKDELVIDVVGEGEGEAAAAEGEKELLEVEMDVDVGVEIENPITALTLEELDSSTTTTAIATGPAAQLTALLARLTDASSKIMIDNIAIEFAFLNSKAARKRLVKFLGSVNRNRTDILPYYARLVGTLDPYMPDIGKELVALLEDEFRYLQRKKNADMAETRSKNLRFLSELTKFNVTPTHSILHIFKVLLDDFSGPNIDNLCTVLEGCGRYLLRSEHTSEKMQGVLAIMKRKKGAMNLDQRQVTMLENAYYQCDPPDRPVVVQKIRTPMQLYIRQLFYNTLTRNSSDKVLKLVRKLHWEEPEIVKKLHSAFTKVWKIKYSNVHLFAVLLYDLGRYHPEFNVGVIDEVLENIRVGMEINSFKYNQQRVATVKYLGELYNYRVIDSRVVFDTLWSLVSFGHPDGRPWPDLPSAIDSPDDCFRVRLICTLLDTCGSCFERGPLKKKLDNFLTFFQLYCLSKGTLPMDVDFMLSDTYEQLRPNLELYKTFEEAVIGVDEMLAKIAISGPIEEPEEILEEDQDGRRAGGEEEEEEGEGESSGEEGSDIEEDNEDKDSDEMLDSDSEDESHQRPKDPNAITLEQEEEFNRELAKMMANTGGEIRKAPERKTGLLDVGVPFVRKSNGGASGRFARGEVDDEVVEGESEKKGMIFTLLTKKGNKQQTYAMEIPLESSIAVHTLEKRAQEKAEQQELKKLVLDYEHREQVNEKQVLKDQMARRGISLKFVPPKT